MTDTLFKKTTAGAIQTWRQEVQGDRFRTHTGQLGGAIVTTAWTACEGKNRGKANETSPAEQARKEVESNYQHQLDRGYHHTVDDAKADQEFRPMLALKWKDRVDKIFDGNAIRSYDDRTPRVFLQAKLDGVRCVAIRGKGLFSREGQPITTVEHVAAAAKKLFDAHEKLMVIDGELYDHDLSNDFPELVSRVKRVQETTAKLEYWVYDCLLRDRTARYYDRYHEFLAPELMEYPFGFPAVPVPTWLCLNRRDVDLAYEECLAYGFEGGMLRLDAAYEPGKRSKTLVKRKEFIDEEFELVSISQGVGNAAGMAKIAVVKLPNGGTCEVDIVGPHDALRVYLKRAKAFIGKSATVVFQGYTPQGKLRFPKLKIAHETPRL